LPVQEASAKQATTQIEQSHDVLSGFLGLRMPELEMASTIILP